MENEKNKMYGGIITYDGAVVTYSKTEKEQRLNSENLELVYQLVNTVGEDLN